MISFTLNKEKVVDSWNMIVEQAAGRDKWLLDMTEEIIKEANMPNVLCHQTEVNLGMSRQTRVFLMLTNTTLYEYRMFIGARDFGASLDVSWFVTMMPGTFKRMVSKYATGNSYALSQNIDIFKQQDLQAFITVAHQCLKRVLDILLEELKLDSSGLRSSKSKGFLSVW